MNYNSYIDHTLLKATATTYQILALCNEAKEFNFYAVCVNSAFVNLASKELKNTEVKVAAVVGFPLGAMSTQAKVFETKQCIKDGAQEIDMVIHIGMLKNGNYQYVETEIADIKKACGDLTLKVIIETCYLTDEEKRMACRLALIAGADFVKTSTGFGTGGATLEDVTLMKNEVGDNMKIKASGGIKDAETARKYIDLGVSRIGTSSGITIVKSN
ncbi:MAG: deoxyribose-phosphate aldolase [Flavobacteriaceae bacterium]|nr:deoxyribose-phosphate aldolase [Flavobacteriaceae bacterium]